MFKISNKNDFNTGLQRKKRPKTFVNSKGKPF